jgi:Zn finger protein HypA/HybF involved in hydrogenase expression
MHEMSMALDVGRIAEERVGAEAAGRIVTVGLEVGTEAGVELASLEFCLEVVLSQPPFRAAKAVIQRRPGDDLSVAYLEVEDDDSNN